MTTEQLQLSDKELIKEIKTYHFHYVIGGLINDLCTRFESLLDVGVDVREQVELKIAEPITDLDYWVKERNIVIWMVPCSETELNGKVTWGWEIEVLPYTEIGFYLRDKPLGYGQSCSNVFYSYQEWQTYDQAKTMALNKAKDIYYSYVIDVVQKDIDQVNANAIIDKSKL